MQPGNNTAGEVVITCHHCGSNECRPTRTQERATADVLFAIVCSRCGATGPKHISSEEATKLYHEFAPIGLPRPEKEEVSKKLPLTGSKTVAEILKHGNEEQVQSTKAMMERYPGKITLDTEVVIFEKGQNPKTGAPDSLGECTNRLKNLFQNMEPVRSTDTVFERYMSQYRNTLNGIQSGRQMLEQSIQMAEDWHAAQGLSLPRESQFYEIQSRLFKQMVDEIEDAHRENLVAFKKEALKNAH